MTSISAVPPGPSVMPAAENKPRVATVGAQFHAQLQAQSRPRLQPPETTNAQVLSDSTTNVSHRPEVEAMIQAVEWRKYAVSAPNRPGRSVPGTRASGLDIADFSFPDRDVSVSDELVRQSCVVEYGRPLSMEPVDDPTALTAGDDERKFSAGLVCEGGLNAFAIAVALSGLTLTWVPTEIVRAPLRSPDIRVRRRRTSSSAEHHLPARSDPQ